MCKTFDHHACVQGQLFGFQPSVYLDVQTRARRVDPHVAMLHGKGCIDVLSQQGRIHNIPREGGSGIAYVDVHRGRL